MVLLVGLATAFTGTLTMNISSSSTVSGTDTIGVTVSDGNISNLTLYGYAADTNQTTASAIATSTANCWLNSTNASCNFSFSSNSLEDSSNWVFYVTGKNKSSPTDTVNTASATSVKVDNGAPTAPTSLSPADGTTDTDGSVTFTASVSSRNTTQGYIEFKDHNPGATIYTQTGYESGGAISIPLTNIPDGVYYWRYVATDGNDVKASGDYKKLLIDVSGPQAAGKYVATQLQQQQRTTLQLPDLSTQNIAVIAIVAAIVLIVMRRKR
jgi:hypothetical protein